MATQTGETFGLPNFVVGVIGLFLATLGIYIGVAVAQHYWPFEMAPGADQSLPAGYAGNWSGEIGVPAHLPGAGKLADIHMSLSPDQGIGEDVGTISVQGPSLAFGILKPDCEASLHWQDGDDPVNLTYDSYRATGACELVSLIAHATIKLEANGDLNYTIDMSGYPVSTDLHH